jgi:hypothetical protein
MDVRRKQDVVGGDLRAAVVLADPNPPSIQAFYGENAILFQRNDMHLLGKKRRDNPVVTPVFEFLPAAPIGIRIVDFALCVCHHIALRNLKLYEAIRPGRIQRLLGSVRVGDLKFEPTATLSENLEPMAKLTVRRIGVCAHYAHSFVTLRKRKISASDAYVHEDD